MCWWELSCARLSTEQSQIKQCCWIKYKKINWITHNVTQTFFWIVKTYVMRLFHAVYAFNAAGWWVVIAMLAVTLCIFIQFRWAFFRLNRAWFIVGHFTKTNRSNVLQFTVMTSMSYHFVGVWTNEITFQTMKMWWLVVCACWKKPKKKTWN